MRKNRWLATLMAWAVVLAIGGCSSSSNTDTAETPPSGTPAAAERKAEARPEPRMVTIPAGTALEVTVDETVSSKTSNEVDHFAASLAAPVFVRGQQLLASRSPVSGTVTVSKSAGRFKGNAELGLTLDSITVDGRRYKIRTTTYSEKSGSRGKRTALGTGIGAAAGAAIGAIAGGGKGAAIGAGAGAGAGVAGSALTGERDVSVPAESKITFELSEPLTIPAPQG